MAKYGQLDRVEWDLLWGLKRDVLILPPMPVHNLNDYTSIAVDLSLAARLHQDRGCLIQDDGRAGKSHATLKGLKVEDWCRQLLRLVAVSHEIHLCGGHRAG